MSGETPGQCQEDSTEKGGGLVFKDMIFKCHPGAGKLLLKRLQAAKTYSGL